MRVKQWLASAALAVAAFAGLVVPSMAQQSAAPVATVVIAPVERTLEDVAWLIEAVNVQGFSGLVKVMGDSYTTGLDKSKPMGVIVTLEEGMPKALVCLPNLNHKEFFEKLSEASLQVDELGKDLYEVAVGPQLLVAKVTKDWIFVGQNEEAVENVPKNPSELFGDYHTRYTMSVKIDLQQIPDELKETAIENLRAGFEGAMQNAPGQTEEQKEAAAEMGELQMAQIEEMINSTQQVVLGWQIDSGKQQVYLDGAVLYTAGSKLAKQMEAQANLKSGFTGLTLPGSSVDVRFTSLATNEDDKKVAKQSMENSLNQMEAQLENSNLPENITEAIQEFAEGFVEIFGKTIDEGVIDGAASASVSDDVLRVVIGGRLADGHALEAELKSLVEELPKTDEVKIEFDVGKHNGFNLHRVSIKVPSNEARAKAMFGDSVKIMIAGGDKAALLALDSTGDATIKAAIDAVKAKPSVDVKSPVQGVIRLTGLLKYAQTLSPNPILENTINELSQYVGKDSVSVNSTILPRGMVTRLTIDEGVLRAAGSAAQTGRAMQGGF